MNQMRFSIGVPKAGSAARTAEDAEKFPSRSILPRAGSSARDAEERKRADGLPLPRAASISMRASGGRVMQPAVRADVSTSCVQPEARIVIERSQTGSNLPSSAVHFNDSASTAPHPERGIVDNASPGPLQTAADRVKSLFRSLISPGGSINKS